MLYPLVTKATLPTSCVVPIRAAGMMVFGPMRRSKENRVQVMATQTNQKPDASNGIVIIRVPKRPTEVRYLSWDFGIAGVVQWT